MRGYNMKDGTQAGELPAVGEQAGSPYSVPTVAVGQPQLLVVTRDIAKGATATLFMRNLDPPLTPFTPPPNAIKVTPPNGVMPAAPEP